MRKLGDYSDEGNMNVAECRIFRSVYVIYKVEMTRPRAHMYDNRCIFFSDFACQLGYRQRYQMQTLMEEVCFAMNGSK